MAEPFCSFAKAYIRYLEGLRPSRITHHRLAALRTLECALSERSQCPAVHKATVDTFNRAAAIAKAHFTDAVTYRVGRVLEVLSRFLDDHMLVDRPLQWRQPFRRPRDFMTRVGSEFEARRMAKLPSAAALDALATTFTRATRTNDVIVSSTAAIMCSNSCRISEVLTLPVDCAAPQLPGQTDDAFGLRWWPSKGAAPMIKWVPGTMVPTVKRALDNLRRATEPARWVSRWYEKHPRQLFLPAELEFLRTKEFLTYEEVTRVLGGGDGKIFCSRLGIRRRRIRRHIVVSFADLELAVISLLPRDFPVFDGRTKLPYSDALFVVLRNQFRDYAAGACPCMIERVDLQNINRGLGTRVKHEGRSMFTRLGLTEEDGSPIVISSHQFRHYLDTLAQKGGMSQLDIAKWSGRTELRQNSTYDHESATELLARLRSTVGDDSSWRGPLPELARKSPIPRSEFAQLIAPTAHSTELGFCIHDFTMTPCQLHLDCLRCSEHLCVKGNRRKTEMIRERLGEARMLLQNASGLDPVRWTVGLRRLPLREHPLERGRADVADGRV